MPLFAKHPDQDHTNRGEIRRLFRRVYARHWVSLSIVLVFTALTGLVTYGYAWAGKVVADDVIEVHLLAADDPAAANLDLSLPSEQRAFELGTAHPRQSLRERIDQRPGRSTREKLHLLGIIAVLMLLMEIVRHAAEWLTLERTVYIGQQVIFRLRQQVHDKLISLPTHYHDRHSPGKLLTHLFSDISVIEEFMKVLIRQVSRHILTLIVGLIIIFYLDTTLSMIVIAAMPFYVVAYKTIRLRMVEINRTWREQEGRLNGHIASRVSGFGLVKAFVREQHESVEFVRAAKPVMRDAVGASMIGAWFGAVCGIITGACMTAVLWLGALRVRDGQMTIGELLLFYTAAGTLFSPVSALAHMTNMLHRLRAVATRVNAVLDEPITIDDPDAPQELPEDSCELRFENVTMRYQPDRPPALEDVSFSLPAGKRLCVMGPSGSGKTTLAKLAVRLYDPQQGVVTYDGHDVRDFRLAKLRDYTSLVNQEPIVFTGSIADNIRYGSDVATPATVTAAARYAQIQSFIEQLPAQYRTLTQERGLTLSGGQKQRLNLARALHADPKMLVLDDCTSALDAHTEAQIVEAFRTALYQRTALLVTHRVSLAFECDYILVLEQGRVAQFGPPTELVRTPGQFAELYKQQTAKARATLRSAASA